MSDSQARAELRVAVEQFGRVAAEIGGPQFFDALVAGLGQIVPFSSSDLVIVDLHAAADASPVLVGIYSNGGSYAEAIREHYLPCGYQLCPEIAAARGGWTNGSFSMADLGADKFFEPACYDA